MDHVSAGEVAVWAHDGHVNRVENRARGAAAPSMGAHLADRYGHDYYALGFEFGGGAFRALVAQEGDGGYEFRECTLDAALPGTVGRALAALDRPLFALDFDSARADQAVERWLDATRGLQSVGAIFHRDDLEHHVERYHLVEAFDGICYVGETSQTRPLDE